MSNAIKIGKDLFYVPTPDGLRSFVFQQDILPVVGRVVAVIVSMLGGAKQPGDILESDLDRVLPAALPHIGRIFADLPRGELERLTRELLGPGPNGDPGATCNKIQLFGAKDGDTFGALMQGRAIDTWKLLWHALGVWYPDFFDKGRSLFAKGAKVSRSEESSTLDMNGLGAA